MIRTDSFLICFRGYRVKWSRAATSFNIRSIRQSGKYNYTEWFWQHFLYINTTNRPR